MKKSLLYTIGFVAFLSLGILLVIAIKNRERRMNERITLKHKDKIPYGFYAARQLLPDIFPDARVYDDKQAPGYWDYLDPDGVNQAVFLTGLSIKADEDEVEELIAFARKGNYVFIISKEVSYEVARLFNINSTGEEQQFMSVGTDSLRVRLQHPRFGDSTHYVYPGRRFASQMKVLDTTRAIILGTDENGLADFVQFKIGQGDIFLHTAPLAFSNYFVLHKKNIGYFEKAVSVVPPGVKRIIWNEYYLNKRTEPKQEEPNFLGVLLKYESFRWALLTAIATIGLYVLIEMRRKQRVIPAIAKPKNESLDFVTTIGQLYYGRKDHGNMVRKMSTYFLEHVRNRFKVSTTVLDESFVHTLHVKSGYPAEDITSIIDFIKIADTADINEHDLNRFYQQLQGFYQNT